MNPMGQWLKQLSGMVSANRYTDAITEVDPAKIAYIRSLRKDLKKTNHLHIPLRDLSVVVFDIETTGFNPQKGDRLLSIGAVKVTGTEVLSKETFYSLVKNEVPPPENISELTGIHYQDVVKAPDPVNVLHDFFSFADKSVLVAHHASHETKFMKHLMWDLFKTSFEHRILDTSFLTRLIPEAYDKITLEDCCSFFDIPTDNRHHALYDAVMTAELWSKAVKSVEEAGIETLKDVYTELSLQ